MKFLTILLCIAVCINNTLVLQDVTALASLVNLNEVLINNTTCTYIQVTYFRVTHLTIWQTYIFT